MTEIASPAPAPFMGTTHIAVILDKSGSMGHLAQEVVSGFNAWLDDQKQDPAPKLLTLSLFDTAVKVPIVSTEIAKVNPLDSTRYSPSGMTALYDAVFKAVGKMDVPATDRALVLVITDGRENSSIECNKAQMRKLIQEKEALGNWTFTYLSASPDAFADAQGAGVTLDNAAAFVATPAGAKNAFNAMRSSSRAYAASASLNSKSFYGPRPRQGSHADPSIPGHTPVVSRTPPSTGWVSDSVSSPSPAQPPSSWTTAD